MQQIIFKKEYLNLIKDGLKTQTIRLWKKKTNIKPGDFVIGTNYRDKLLLKINLIYEKKFSEINHQESILDGFKTKEDLTNAAIDLYGEKILNSFVTVLRFTPQIQTSTF